MSGIYLYRRALYMLARMTAPGESLEILRKRLLFRSWRRGTREMDLYLGGFAERNLETFSRRQLELYDGLLEYSDADLLGWMTGREAPPAALDHDVMKLLKQFKILATND